MWFVGVLKLNYKDDKNSYSLLRYNGRGDKILNMLNRTFKIRSASFNIHVFLMGNHTDAWPAISFHFGEIFHAC